jgi:hypothetical protein
MTTASGVAGEMRVAGELCRHGFHVAKPYWGDDEVDLLVFVQRGSQIVFIPVQVKTVQFPVATSKTPEPKSFIQGLKKRYVQENEWLCLAIYNPAEDCFWFVDGSDRIRDAYNSQKDWHKHKPFDDLRSEDDVRIGCSNLSSDTTAFNADYKIPPDAARFWSDRIGRIANQIAGRRDNVDEIKAAMGW